MQRVMPDRLLQSMMTADRHSHVHDAVTADDHAGLHFNYALERDLNTMMHVLPFLPPIFLYMIHTRPDLHVRFYINVLYMPAPISVNSRSYPYRPLPVSEQLD